MNSYKGFREIVDMNIKGHLLAICSKENNFKVFSLRQLSRTNKSHSTCRPEAREDQNLEESQKMAKNGRYILLLYLFPHVSLIGHDSKRSSQEVFGSNQF